jgi:hypothetical protein
MKISEMTDKPTVVLTPEQKDAIETATRIAGSIWNEIFSNGLPEVFKTPTKTQNPIDSQKPILKNYPNLPNIEIFDNGDYDGGIKHRPHYSGQNPPSRHESTNDCHYERVLTSDGSTVVKGVCN